MGTSWQKGRGKLGALRPLLGRWEARADSEMGPVHCVREFREVLGGRFVELRARWEFAEGKGVEGSRTYEELAVYGADESGTLCFWSFTSDGKRSQGTLTSAEDVHAQALAFEAQMPAGLARTVYWPHAQGGFAWAVEAKAKRGWNRFLEHHYVESGALAGAARPKQTPAKKSRPKKAPGRA